MKAVTVCADDFGLTGGVCSGIVECISATSCMTTRPEWRTWGRELKPFAGVADIGLHFTLTDQEAAGEALHLAPDGRFMPLSHLLRLSLTRSLPRQEVQEQLDRQLDAFEDVFNAPPAHVDGHHHVHQLPGVREIVVATLTRRYRVSAPYLRACCDTVKNIWSRGVARPQCLAIGLFGTRFRALAAAACINTNQGFSGIYTFVDRRQITSDFSRFLKMPGPRMLVMCHPGHADAKLAALDKMTSQRDAELAFLLGDSWLELVSASGLRLARLVDAG